MPEGVGRAGGRWAMPGEGGRVAAGREELLRRAMLAALDEAADESGLTCVLQVVGQHAH